MNTEVVTIVVAVLSSSLLTSVVTALAMKGKVRAQTQNITLEGDIKIGESWREYAIQMAKDMKAVKTELGMVHNKNLELEKNYNDLIAKYDVLESNYQQLINENENLRELNHTLEQRVSDLQAELTQYKKDNK